MSLAGQTPEKKRKLDAASEEGENRPNGGLDFSTKHVKDDLENGLPRDPRSDLAMKLARMQSEIEQLKSENVNLRSEVAVLRGIKGERKQGSAFSELPFDLVVDILRCADYVTQCRIRRACKWWQHLMTIPEVSRKVFADVRKMFDGRVCAEAYFQDFIRYWCNAATSHPFKRQLTLNAGFSSDTSVQILLLLDYFLDSSGDDIDESANLEQIILRYLKLSGSVADSDWMMAFTWSCECPVKVINSTCELRVPVLGPTCQADRKQDTWFYWTVWLDEIAFGNAGRAHDQMTALWWPYPEEQTLWLKTNIGHVWSDRRWFAFLRQYCLCGVGMQDIYQMILREREWLTFDLGLFGLRTAEIFCQMAAFILQLRHAGFRHLTPPPCKLPFDAPALYRNAYEALINDSAWQTFYLASIHVRTVEIFCHMASFVRQLRHAGFQKNLTPPPHHFAFDVTASYQYCSAYIR